MQQPNLEQPNKQEKPDVFANIRAWALRTELDERQKHYLDVLVSKLNRILTGRTVEQLSEQKDLESLSAYLEVITRINQLLKEKRMDAAFEREELSLDNLALNVFEDSMKEFPYSMTIDNAIAESLAGLDSERAWEIRESLLKKREENLRQVDRGKDWIPSVLIGLSGVDSERSWQIRNKYKNFDKVQIPRFFYPFLQSLMGLESKQARQARQDSLNLIKSFKISPGDKTRYFTWLYSSLTGLDTDQTWLFRDQIMQEAVFYHQDLNYRFLAIGLAGLESQRAWDMRQKLKLKEVDVDSEALDLSVLNLDSEQAWQWRDQVGKSYYKEFNFQKCLAGLDSEQAWKIRDDFNIEKRPGISAESLIIYREAYAQGLAGLNSSRAWEKRDYLFDKISRDIYIKSLRDTPELAAIHQAQAFRKDR